MAFTLSQATDLINSTLNAYKKNRIQQVAQSHATYPACNYFFRKEGEGRMLEDGGVQVEREVWIKKSNTATSTTPYDVDDTNVETLTTVAKVPWRFYKSHWDWDIRETAPNAGEARLYNMMTVRQNNAWLSIIELLSAHLWLLPASTNEVDLFGIPYYIVKNTSTGFNGGHPSGYSAVANISRTTYANWKNYTALYTTVTKADLITTMRTAFRYQRWQDIEGLSMEDYRRGRDKYINFVNGTTMSGFENIGESQNENLGRDVAPFEGANDVYRFEGGLTFRRKPIVFEQELDGDTNNPVYSLDMSTWCMYVQKGANLRRSDPIMVGNNHNAFQVWYDLTCQLLCVDPRRNAVFYINN